MNELWQKHEILKLENIHFFLVENVKIEKLETNFYLMEFVIFPLHLITYPYAVSVIGLMIKYSILLDISEYLQLECISNGLEDYTTLNYVLDQDDVV